MPGPWELVLELNVNVPGTWVLMLLTFHQIKWNKGVGRRPRILLAGGIYHVYDWVYRGERVFRDEDGRFEALLAATKKRDHFHIVSSIEDER